MASKMASSAVRTTSLLRTAHSPDYRSMYLRVRPMPKTLTERRAVLDVLKSHGRIEMFKQLDDPSSFVAIAAEPEALEEIVSKSPLQLDIPDVNVVDYRAIPKREDAAAAVDGKQLKTFTMEIFPTADYRHKKKLREGGLLWDGWKDDKAAVLGDTFIQKALRQVVPKGVAHEAFVDWESSGQDPEVQYTEVEVEPVKKEANFAERRLHKKRLEGIKHLILTGTVKEERGKEKAEEGGDDKRVTK